CLFHQPAHPIDPTRGALRDPHNIFSTSTGRSWRADELWREPGGRISSGGRVCRPHPQGREARGPAGGAVDQVRASHQCADGEITRPRPAADAHRHRRRGDRVRRREFITLLGGAAVWPVSARAQQPERIRRVGWLAGGLAMNDPESRGRNDVFLQILQELGWTPGHNLQIDYRWGGANPDITLKQAAELIALAPDVVLATASHSVHALKQASSTVPIVFVQVPDPVGAGFVDNLARPGGNATGFTSFEYAIGSKWLELLKEIAPAVKRAAILRDATNPAGIGQWGAIQSVAPSFGVELSAVNMRAETGEIEHAVAAFARQPNSGLILTASANAAARRDALIAM